LGGGLLHELGLDSRERAGTDGRGGGSSANFLFLVFSWIDSSIKPHGLGRMCTDCNGDGLGLTREKKKRKRYENGRNPWATRLRVVRVVSTVPPHGVFFFFFFLLKLVYFW
jgi:hypothetical protein